VQFYCYFVSQFNGFAAITLCVASQWVSIVFVVYFVIDSVRKFLDTTSYAPRITNEVAINKYKVCKIKLTLFSIHYRVFKKYGEGTASLIFNLDTLSECVCEWSVWRSGCCVTVREEFQMPTGYEVGWAHNRSGLGSEEKISTPNGNRTPVAHPVAIHLLHIGI
jgi:hypothetical protein